MRFLSILLAAVLPLAPSLCLAAGPGSVKAFDTANLDTTCKPCEDFDKFANGGWKAKNAIPAEYPAWGSFEILHERNLEALHQILERAAKVTNSPKGSNEQKIGDFYFSVLNTQLSDTEGVRPLAPFFARIAAIKDVAGLQDTIAHLHTYSVGAVFDTESGADLKNSKQTIAYVSQGGLGLPDRDYYLKNDDKSKGVRDAYLNHVARMFELTGDEAAKAAAGAKTVMAIETRLAGASLTNVELRDPDASYHMMGPEERAKLAPNIAWDRYLSQVGISDSRIDVAHPKFFQEVDKMLGDVSLDDWKTYLRWWLVHSLAGTLSTQIADENFNFNGRILTGAEKRPPQWKQAVRATDASLGEILGQVYVKEHFTPAAKQRMLELVRNLKVVLREDLVGLEWMGDATRKQALAKLDSFADKIGYPDKWQDYTLLEVDRGPYVLNALRARLFAFKYQIGKVGKPVDRAEWGMTPPTVNAGYNPLNNDITFPAGILQPPFFNPDADDAINYGGIGAVIGHEMTHGFDDQGSRFDAEGNLKNWWSEADLKNFKTRAKCIEDQFSAYTIQDNIHLNGQLVAGESIADLGGLKIAYAAFLKSLEGKPRPKDIDGFTPEQRFFLGYAQVWAANHRPEFERLMVNTNVHPLEKFRLNGTVANMPEFQRAFNCKPGDPMVRAAEARCEIW
jgi:putative endopeptidase